MKYILAFLFAAQVWAATPVISSAAVVDHSHSSVTITGQSNITVSIGRIKYWLTSAPGTVLSSNDKVWSGGATYIGHVQGNLIPGASYTFQLCATDTAEGCSSDIVQVMDAAPSDRFARPTEPTGVTPAAYPSSFVRTYSVNSAGNCNGTAVTGSGATWAGGLQESITHAAAAATSTGNVLIQIPAYSAGGNCIPTAGTSYVLKARSGGGTGQIVIAPSLSLVSTLVPELHTMYESIATTGDLPRITGVYSNAYFGGAFSAEAGAANYRLAGLEITNAEDAADYKTVSSYSGGTITLTGASGLTSNYIVTFYNPTTLERWPNVKVTVTGANTMTIASRDTTHATGTLAAGWHMVGPTFPTFYCLVCLDGVDVGTVTDITFDRCYIHGKFPYQYVSAVRAVNVTRLQYVGMSDANVVGFGAIDPDTGTELNSSPYAYPNEPATVRLTGSDNVLIYRSHFKSPGITVFAEGGPFGTPQQANNVLIKQNLFEWGATHFRQSATFHGNQVSCREGIEDKSGSNWWLTGNDFKSFWNCGITGSFASAIIFSPRPADGNVAALTTANKISHVIVEYNFFRDVAGAINVGGYDAEALGPQVALTRKFLFQHNLITGMNPWTRDHLGTAGVRGNFWYIYGVEDAAVVHNTLYNMHGSSPDVFYAFDQGATGLKFTNNIIGYNSSAPGGWYNSSRVGSQNPAPSNGTGSAITQIKNQSKTTDGTVTATVDYNLFIPGVISSATPNYATTGVTQAACQTSWDTAGTHNICATGTNASDRLLYPSFLSTTGLDLRLKYNSPWNTAAKVTDDLLDAGADIPALYVAAGKMLYPPRFIASTLRYVAPSTEACYYKPANSLVTGSWTSDGGGSRIRNTSVTLGGATGLWLWCETELYSFSVTGGAGSLVAP